MHRSGRRAEDTKTRAASWREEVKESTPNRAEVVSFADAAKGPSVPTQPTTQPSATSTAQLSAIGDAADNATEHTMGNAAEVASVDSAQKVDQLLLRMNRKLSVDVFGMPAHRVFGNEQLASYCSNGIAAKKQIRHFLLALA